MNDVSCIRPKFIDNNFPYLLAVKKPSLLLFFVHCKLLTPDQCLRIRTPEFDNISSQDLAPSRQRTSTVNVKPNDSFQLYDLRIEVTCPEGERILCGAKKGDYFTLQGEMLYLPPGQGISIYSLGMCVSFSFFSHINISTCPAAVLPLLAAKQRPTHANDWMTTDAEIACPDPHCKSWLRIVRTALRTFSHADVTVVPLHTVPQVQAS